MLFSEVIDDLIYYADNSQDGIEAEERRFRHARTVRQVIARIRYYRDWAFARTTATLTMAANTGSVKVPTDFLQVGGFGGLYNVTEGGYRMHEESEQFITELRALSQDVTSIYSLFGSDTASPATRLIQVPTRQALTLLLSYVTKVPDLADSTAHGGDDVKDAALHLALPTEYHESVLIPGCRAMARESHGDARWQNAQAEFALGLKLMLRTCRRSQGTLRQLPSFFG